MQPLTRRKTFSLAALGVFVVIAVGLGVHFNFFGRADTATLYVATTGSDSNACTQAAPCLSFDHAYHAAAAGDIVQVAGGVYNTPFKNAAGSTMNGEVITWDATKAKATSNVIFQPASGASVTVNGNIRVFSSHVTFENMSLVDPSNSQNKYDAEAYNYDPNGVSAGNDVGNITFQNLTARNFEISATHDVSVLGGSYGPASACGSGKPSLTQYGGGNNALRPEPGAPDPYNILIDGVTVHNIMSYDLIGCHTEGVAIFSGSAAPAGASGPGGVTIKDSKFYGNDIYDILAQSNSGSKPLGQITLENNWFASSTNSGGSGSGSYSVEMDSIASNVTIDNNSFNYPFLFQDLSGSPSNINIIGNIIQGPITYSTSSGSPGSACGRAGITAQYNITQAASGQHCTTATNTEVTSTSALYTNPTSDASLNFAPKAGTQAIGFVPASASPIKNDIDYHCRPTSGNIDAGATELGSAGSCGNPITGGTNPPPGDTTPPSVSVSAPAQGATVSTTTSLTATASDNVGVSSVQFKLDGANLGAADTASPYAYSWDTTTATNGTHTLSAVATDTSGNTTTATSITVTVNNSTGSTPGCTTTVNTASALTSAVSSAAKGDTICVASGNYGAMTWTGGTSRTSKAVVKPASGATVTFTGTLTINASEVEVQNLSLAGQQYLVNAPAHDIQMTNVTAGRFELDSTTGSGVSNFTIKGGSLGPWHSYPDNRIASSNGSTPNSNILIDGVNFHDFTIPSTSSEHFECLQVWSANGITIQNSKFTNCSFFDIFIQKADASPVPPTPTNVTIQNNFLDCCTYSDTGAFSNYAIQLPTDHSEGAWNNITIRNNSGDAPYLIGYSGHTATFSGDTIENNIAPRLDFDIGSSGVPSGLKVDYNEWYTGGKLGTHDLTGASVASLFTNFAGRDFHLNSGAAVIDKADPAVGAYPTTDIDGDTRPQGAGPDIGADEVTGTTTVTPPTVPTGLHSSGTTQTSISLAWTASIDSSGPGLAGYHVYRNGSLVGTATGTSYTDTGLKASTAYSYTLDAYDKNGNASAQTSPPVSVTTAAAQQSLNPPTGFKASVTGPTSVALSWTASTSTNVSHYYVVRSDSHNPAATIATLGNVTSYTDSTALANTAYTYYVMAGDSSGNFSSPSNTVTVTTPAPPDTTAPSVPTGLTAQAASSVQVNLGWTASTDTGGSGLAGYHIYRSDKGAGIYATVTSGTTWGESGLTPSTSYTYSVKAFDGAGNISGAATVTVTTPAASGSVTLGANKVRKGLDTLAMGSAKAYKVSAKGNGSITKVQLYLDGSSKSGLVTAGVYQNTGQRTGKLLSQGSSAQLKAGAWNTITIPQTMLADGQSYWIAVLNRSSGSLVLRDTVRGFADTVNANPNLTGLPTQWSPGTSYKNSPVSAYGTN